MILNNKVVDNAETLKLNIAPLKASLKLLLLKQWLSLHLIA